MSLRNLFTAGILAAGLASMTMYMGCKIDSADSVIRNVRINVGGLYANNGSRIISQHTGAAITQLNVIQDGDRLQAVDNNGLIFRGTIGNTAGAGANGTDSSATFTLTGRTTAGQEGIISGTITVAGNNATMRGTWAEPSLFGNVLATAQVVPTPTPPVQPTNGVPTNANTQVNIGVVN